MRVGPLGLAVVGACHAAPPFEVTQGRVVEASPPPRAERASAPAIVPLVPLVAPSPALACAADGDCGFDPSADACSSDARANRQAPVVDQGILCFCEAGRCGTLRVAPVPCESDASCAVDLEPRPHPVAATRAHPHERGRPCADVVLSTTCERTNICTMQRLRCPPR